MKKLLLLLIIPFLSFGQGWELIWGDNLFTERSFSIQQTIDGGYIIAGCQNNEDIPTVLLIKISELGEVEDIGSYGDVSSSSFGYSVKQTIDGGYIVCGKIMHEDQQNIYDENLSDVFLVKTDSQLQEEWNKKINITYESDTIFYPDKEIYWTDTQESGYDIQLTNDGKYIICGEIYSSGKQNILLLKIDENGNTIWSKVYDNDCSLESWSGGYSAQQTDDTGYIISGWGYISDDCSYSLLIIKTYANGDISWEKSFNNYGGGSFPSGQHVQQTDDGGYIVCGSFYTCCENNINVKLLKLDSNGYPLWDEVYFISPQYPNLINDIFAHSVQQTDDSGYIICGQRAYNSAQGGLINRDVFLIKTDSTGVEEWVQFFDINIIDQVYSVQQTDDGGYIICGAEEPVGNDANVLVIKTDFEGNVTSTNIIETPTINKNLITTVDILGREATNKGFQLYIYDDGSVEKKYLIK